MVAVRNLLSTLNNLAHSGLLATGRLRPSEEDGAPPPADAPGGGLPDPWQQDYLAGGVDPPLDELLDDPVVHLMMRADHLEPDEVRRQLVSGGRLTES
jgi:hypothetical protein